MGGKIFINYRRGEDQALAGRLFDRLGEAFGREQLFMDVDSIAPGLDFVRVLEKHLGQCDIVLTVIGKGWLDARPRLDDPLGEKRKVCFPASSLALGVTACLKLRDCALLMQRHSLSPICMQEHA